MSLHPEFPRSPYAPLIPSQRWFPADETLRSTAYEKLLPPLVAKIREEVHAWRQSGYRGATATSASLLHWWFDTDHLLEEADGSLSPFRYYFAQREAVETLIWLHDVKQARDKFDLMRFDASGAVSSGMFDEAWPRYVLKMATGAGKTKVMSLLIAWSFFHRLYESGLHALTQLPRHCAQHHRPRPAARGFRRPAHLLQRPGAPGQRPRRPQLARRLPGDAAHSRRCPRRA